MDLALIDKRQAKPRRFLPRGEAAIASTGLMLSLIIVGAMIAAAGWAGHRHDVETEQARYDDLVALGSLLADQADLLLARDELGLLQYLVIGAAQRAGLSRCQIILGDGSIVAATDPTVITTRTLPDRWSGLAATDSRAEGAPWVFAMNIDDRGPARLELVPGPAEDARPFIGDLEVGLAVIGGVAMLLLWITYRRTRRRMNALALVRESLFALSAGESSTAALSIPTEVGPEALAWNEMLADRARLQQASVAKRLLELPAAASDRRSDLSSMCDAMSQGLLLVNNDLEIDYVNGAAALYLGAARESLRGASISEVVQNPAVREAIESIASGTLRRGTSMEIERSGESAGVLRFGVRPVRHDDESSVMVIIEDVTQQRLASESRNSFVAQVTHELRMPLTNIMLYAESAMDAGDENPQQRSQSLNVINQEAKRLNRIVNDMLSVAELEAGTHELHVDDLALAVLFEELEADYLAQARERGVTLEFDLPPKLPTIQADRDKIGLALHNLVGNALKYTPEGGRVSIEVEVTDAAVTVKVRDTGLGIADVDQERIFEKFYRADDERIAGITGSGLGLALARDVVRLHGGDITVESQVDDGSVFTLSVPVLAIAA